MSKDKLKEFADSPEVTVDPQKDKVRKKDKVEELLEQFKDLTGLEVEPVKTSKYKLKKTMMYLEAKFDFRFNLFAKKPEVKLKNETEWEFFEERDIDNLYNELELEAGISLAHNKLLSLIGSKYVSEDYDPILEYINALPKWDGQDRFPEFLRQIQLKDEQGNRDFLYKYFTKWFVNMVASLLTPDIINEQAIVFTGEEGRGKTRFFANLIPKELRLKYFYSALFNPKDKDHYEYLATKILIFLDEMATITRTDEYTLKQTMSERQITLRRAYGRGAIYLHRRASFAGAINDDKFLLDQGANRRWLPFHIHKIDVDYDFDIRLLYSQAVAMFKDNFNLFYDVDEIDELKKRNDEFRRKSPEEELIMLHWSVPTKQDLDECTFLQYLTPTDVMYELSSNDQYKKMNTNDSVLKRIGRTLQSLNFPTTKRRLNNYANPRDCYIMMPVDSSAVERAKKGEKETPSSFL